MFAPISTQAQTIVQPLSLIKLPDIGPSDIFEVVNRIIALLLGVAGIVALVFLIFAGYKYITASGDTEKMGQAKTQILGVIIGLIIIISAWAIVKFIDNVLQGKITEITFQLREPTPITSETGGKGTETEKTDEAPGETGKAPTSPEAVGPETALPPKPDKISRPDDTCEYPQAKFDACSTITSQMYECLEQIDQFLYPASGTQPCANTFLTETGLQACQNMQNLRSNLIWSFSVENSVKICQTQVPQVFKSCIEDNPPNPDACKNQVKSYIKTINSSIAQGQKQSQAQPRETAKRELSPYQKCTQEAREKYNECRNEVEVVCAAQKIAYETCLKTLLGWISKNFCEKARKKYYECDRMWRQTCQKEYSRQMEYCNIHYRTY